MIWITELCLHLRKLKSNVDTKHEMTSLFATSMSESARIKIYLLFNVTTTTLYIQCHTYNFDSLSVKGVSRHRLIVVRNPGGRARSFIVFFPLEGFLTEIFFWRKDTFFKSNPYPILHLSTYKAIPLLANKYKHPFIQLGLQFFLCKILDERSWCTNIKTYFNM